MHDDYRFPGIREFLEAAGLEGSPLVKAPGTWWISRAVDALSQLPLARLEDRQAMLAVALNHRNEMAVALAGLDAAIESVRSHCCHSQPKTKASSTPNPQSSSPESS
jgi:hypothetical protein